MARVSRKRQAAKRDADRRQRENERLAAQEIVRLEREAVIYHTYFAPLARVAR